MLHTRTTLTTLCFPNNTASSFVLFCPHNHLHTRLIIMRVGAGLAPQLRTPPPPSLTF